MPEAEKKEKPSQIKVCAGNQSQYLPDQTLRRVMIEKAEKSEESKKNE